MTDNATLVAVHARVMARATEVVNAVTPADLDRPTPCEAWNLGQLLAHTIGQNHGFAAAAMGETRDVTVWADRAVGDGPGEASKAFAASAERVVRAFGEPGALEHPWWLPEFPERFPGRMYPGHLAAGFHLIDYVVHAWDVAVTLGRTVVWEPDVLAVALPIAAAVPDGSNRQLPGASFKPALSPRGGGAFEEILLMLGRDPKWTVRSA